jgi:hypothetical protein
VFSTVFDSDYLVRGVIYVRLGCADVLGAGGFCGVRLEGKPRETFIFVGVAWAVIVVSCPADIKLGLSLL